ncbi:hypothetical protein Q5425_35715 [Amycolatopsis sp. A133]|uniref:hypothetical protein n=1 Tax=Amycolatopsis sp. A133 TaxID=3064472 RepID=UPI0027FDC395|nr:hypothetical protein [Amycolatopsis sp. A133]MDQ7809104.1 hypothetical protein [Amycolatopsis sp. A133]
MKPNTMTTPRRRALGTLVLSLVLATAACSEADAPGGAPSTGPVAADGPVKFTQCLRERGITVADPPPGALTVQLPPEAKTDPATRDAVAQCGHLLDTGSGKNPADPAAHDKAVQLAGCLRAHGLDIADPAPGEPLRLTIDAKDPAAMQAVQGCRDQAQRNGG